jgi:hypothetical protein
MEMRNAGKSIETSLDAADMTVRATLTMDHSDRLVGI